MKKFSCFSYSSSSIILTWNVWLCTQRWNRLAISVPCIPNNPRKNKLVRMCRQTHTHAITAWHTHTLWPIVTDTQMNKSSSSISNVELAGSFTASRPGYWRFRLAPLKFHPLTPQHAHSPYAPTVVDHLWIRIRTDCRVNQSRRRQDAERLRDRWVGQSWEAERDWKTSCQRTLVPGSCGDLCDQRSCWVCTY